MARKGSNKAVWTYAFEHYTSDPLTHPDCADITYTVCALCGNKGIVDTTNSAFDAHGRSVGKRTYCICPNGQVLRFHKASVER